MGYAGVPGTGIKRLMLSSVPFFLQLVHMILVFTPDLFVILGTLRQNMFLHPVVPGPVC